MTSIAFNKNVKCYKINIEDADLTTVFSKHTNFIVEKLSKHFNKFKNIKWSLSYTSFIPFEGNDKKTAKGVLKSAIKKQIKFKDYEECLFKHKEKFTIAYMIGSTNHMLFTQKLTKLALSPFDDKRYVMEDGIMTYAYGHYNI